MKPKVRRIRAAQQSGQAGLIGLLVVILIVAILADTMYPKIAGRNEYAADGSTKGAPTPIDRAYDVACTEYMGQVAAAAGEYRQDHNSPPPDLESLKRYGVTEEIINTPDCNFGLPKRAQPVQPVAAPGVPGAVTVYGAAPQPSSGAAGYGGGAMYGHRHRGYGGETPGDQQGQDPGAGGTSVMGPTGGQIHIPTGAASGGYDLGQ